MGFIAIVDVLPSIVYFIDFTHSHYYSAEDLRVFQKEVIMGIILWGFLLVMLFCGIKPALIIYGGAALIGFAWGTYKFFKNRN